MKGISLWSRGYNYPEDYVGCDPGEDCKAHQYDEGNPYKYGINAKPFSQASVNTGDNLVFSRTVKSAHPLASL